MQSLRELGNSCFLRLKAIPYGFRPFLIDSDRKEFIAVIERIEGPAGAFEQEYTVLRNSLFNNALSDDTGTVKITYINLVVRSKAILGLKSTRKLISEINVQLLDRPQVFLLGKTVGSCTDAPAGPESPESLLCPVPR